MRARTYDSLAPDGFASFTTFQATEAHMTDTPRQPIDVEHEHTDDSGEIVLLRGGHRIGELTWVRSSPDILDFNHTWISPTARGEKLGTVLIEQGVAFAREVEARVNPACPYVAHIFDSTDTYADIDSRS